MSYVIAFYWPYLIAALVLGTLAGWWAESRWALDLEQKKREGRP